MQQSFPCEYAPFCGVTFSKRSNVVRHCAAKHGGVGRLFCTQCGELSFFNSAVHQREHDALHHPLRHHDNRLHDPEQRAVNNPKLGDDDAADNSGEGGDDGPNDLEQRGDDAAYDPDECCDDTAAPPGHGCDEGLEASGLYVDDRVPVTHCWEFEIADVSDRHDDDEFRDCHELDDSYDAGQRNNDELNNLHDANEHDVDHSYNGHELKNLYHSDPRDEDNEGDLCDLEKSLDSDEDDHDSEEPHRAGYADQSYQIQRGDNVLEGPHTFHYGNCRTTRQNDMLDSRANPPPRSPVDIRRQRRPSNGDQRGLRLDEPARSIALAKRKQSMTGGSSAATTDGGVLTPPLKKSKKPRSEPVTVRLDGKQKTRVQCKYFPVCRKSFATSSSMVHHCRTLHKEATNLFCTVCPELKSFNGTKSMNRHKKVHLPPVVCDRCHASVSVNYFKKHRKACSPSQPESIILNAHQKPNRILASASSSSNGSRSSHGIGIRNRISNVTRKPRTAAPRRDYRRIAIGEVSSNDGSDYSGGSASEDEFLAFSDGEGSCNDDERPKTRIPAKKMPKGTFTRSSHRAPSAAAAQEQLKDYYKWLSRGTALHRTHDTSVNVDQHFNKFRTVIGKLAQVFKTDNETVMRRLQGSASCVALFNSSTMDEFYASLDKSDKGRPLKKSSIYNYVVQIQNFLTWQLKVNKLKRLSSVFDEVSELLGHLTSQKKRDRDPVEKNQMIEALPKVPDIWKFLDNDLKVKMKKAEETFLTTGRATWDVYEHFRNYMMVMLLFKTPPQRLHVYDRLTTDSVSNEGDKTSLTIRKHKTSCWYGPVIIAIPDAFNDFFQVYLKLRAGVSSHTNDKAFFVDRDGRREMSLTKRLQFVMYQRFGVPVNIRDCRSMYISYYCPQMEIPERMALAKSMYHSYATQQLIYLCFDAKKAAFGTLDIVERYAPSTSQVP